MALDGRYRIPREFRDEDKWFRFFTKKQLIYVAIAVAIDFVFITMTLAFHIVGVGIALSVICLMIALFLAFFVIPTDKYLIGGGYPVMAIISRVVYRHMPGNRILYVKNYKKEEEI